MDVNYTLLNFIRVVKISVNNITRSSKRYFYSSRVTPFFTYLKRLELVSHKYIMQNSGYPECLDPKEDPS